MRIKWRVGCKNPIDYNYLQKIGPLLWSGWRDLNSRHPAPKAGALPDCATPRKEDLDPFSVKHFETNIFFCKCFTAVRSTFDNLWCQEGREKTDDKIAPPDPKLFPPILLIHNFMSTTDLHGP